jgi:hypothetical protein
LLGAFVYGALREPRAVELVLDGEQT